MSGTQHTPGPWSDQYVGCEKAILIGTADFVTAFARMQSFDGTPDAETQAANARLIAAAPDLLAALQALRDWDEQCNPAGYAGLPDGVRALMYAAIDKALAQAPSAVEVCRGR